MAVNALTRESWRKNAVSVVLFLLFVSVVTSYERYWSGQNESQVGELKEMLSTLRYPRSAYSGLSVNVKSNQVMVSESFGVLATRDEVVQYYVENLLKTGWGCSGLRPCYDWGRDLGDAELRFRRGQHDISIWFYGERAVGVTNVMIHVIWRAQ